MPIPDIGTARGEILSHFTTAWNAQTPPVPTLLYQDKKTPRIPDSGPWARINVQHNDRDRATVGGNANNRRFRAFGIIIVQIFTPYGDGLTNNDSLVNVAVNAFEGTKTGEDRVEFRNVRSQEIGEDGPWFQTNVIAEFDYDLVK